MTVLKTIGDVILFLLCLSFVVCIHEAGHLAVAKACKVYCFEYSIGFGPAFFKHTFKHKKKGADGKYLFDASGKAVKEPGETKLCLRVLPLGGYVSMAGEMTDGDVGVLVPKERTLNGVNHAKQLAIMLAGITMNFILAFILLLADYGLCDQYKTDASTNMVTVGDNTAGSNAGLVTGDRIIGLYQTYYLTDTSTNTVVTREFPIEADRKELTSYQTFITGAPAQTYDTLTKDCVSYAAQDVIFHNLDTTLTVISGFDGLVVNTDSTRVMHLTYYPKDTTVTTTKDVTLSYVESTLNSQTIRIFDKLGISPTIVSFRYGAGEAWGVAGKQFGNLFVNLYGALGSLFTPSGWQNVGGIISVYKLSAEATGSSAGFGNFLLIWGYISLNLGCFNLLPFPGLDGWQALIAIIESIRRKKIPSKYKNIANTVGIIILFVLAGLLLIKDIMHPVI
jgi:regulator of sigma E protease